MPTKELSELLPNRTPGAVKSKGNSLGLKKLRRDRDWSISEDAVIKTHYATKTKDELCKLLPNRTWKAIEGRASEYYGLRRRVLS